MTEYQAKNAEHDAAKDQDRGGNKDTFSQKPSPDAPRTDRR
jgi:hypothetical protein